MRATGPDRLCREESANALLQFLASFLELAPQLRGDFASAQQLKECGMKAPTANMVASLTAGMFGRADVRRWDTSFAPFQGRLTSNLNWYVELGDLRYIRLVAESANGETVYRGDWLPLDLSRPTMDVTPIVSIRVDLTQIARLLR